MSLKLEYIIWVPLIQCNVISIKQSVVQAPKRIYISSIHNCTFIISFFITSFCNPVHLIKIKGFIILQPLVKSIIPCIRTYWISVSDKIIIYIRYKKSSLPSIAYTLVASGFTPPVWRNCYHSCCITWNWSYFVTFKFNL